MKTEWINYSFLRLSSDTIIHNPLLQLLQIFFGQLLCSRCKVDQTERQQHIKRLYRPSVYSYRPQRNPLKPLCLWLKHLYSMEKAFVCGKTKQSRWKLMLFVRWFMLLHCSFVSLGRFFFCLLQCLFFFVVTTTGGRQGWKTSNLNFIKSLRFSWKHTLRFYTTYSHNFFR